tara:strand:- start:762 stop:998 length:237 start_codon:yes stop_codon:yes gene_type:complete
MTPLKIILLKDHTHLIGAVTELDEEPSYLISDCMKIDDGNYIKYPLYTDQRDIFLTSDVVLTIVEPSEETLTNYKKAL